MGIGKWQDFDLSGERYLIREYLPRVLKHGSPTLLDIGANRGEYTQLLVQAFPLAKIFAFEPNPKTIEVLSTSIRGTNVEIVPKGVSSHAGVTKIWTYADDDVSGHATIYPQVLPLLHHARALQSFEIELTTIDEFCESRGLLKIDFLKIDTEGNELEVLKGARRMLSQKRITMIQFEFNEMNVVSRCFLKDFYDILSGYRMYRLDSRRLIPLGDYHPYNEVFVIHNIVAVADDV